MVEERLPFATAWQDQIWLTICRALLAAAVLGAGTGTLRHTAAAAVSCPHQFAATVIVRGSLGGMAAAAAGGPIQAAAHSREIILAQV